MALHERMMIDMVCKTHVREIGLINAVHTLVTNFNQPAIITFYVCRLLAKCIATKKGTEA